MTGVRRRIAPEAAWGRCCLNREGWRVRLCGSEAFFVNRSTTIDPVVDEFRRGLQSEYSTIASSSSCRPSRKDVMSSPSDPTCRELLSSSSERVRAGLETVELEEARCEHRNRT
jgi:hypothetical protein